MGIEAKVSRSIEVSAVVTRATTGKKEDLGVIASSRKGNVVGTISDGTKSK